MKEIYIFGDMSNLMLSSQLKKYNIRGNNIYYLRQFIQIQNLVYKFIN